MESARVRSTVVTELWVGYVPYQAPRNETGDGNDGIGLAVDGEREAGT